MGMSRRKYVQDMRYKKNFKYNLELLIVPIICLVTFFILMLLSFPDEPFVIVTRGIGTLFGVGFIFSFGYFLKDLKKQRMTIYGKLCADVPRCFNISLGNKEIAKRIMLDAHRNKKYVEKYFDEWVILCVRDKLINRK